MKNLRHALAFSVTVLLVTGCPKKGVEPPERADASLADAAAQVRTGSTSQALQDAGALQAAATGEDDGGTTFERSDSLPSAGTARDAGSVGQPGPGIAVSDAGTRADAGSAQRAGSAKESAAAAAREACVDRWLEAQNLDRYGHKKGTMYAGGTPLFDERTGETRDRVEYVLSRHAAAKKACPQ